MNSRWPGRQEWSRIGLEAVVLLVLGMLLGLTINYRVAMNVLSGEIAAPERGAPGEKTKDDAEPLPVPIALDEAREVLARGGVAVDARTAEAYRQGHIPDAVSLPLVDYDQHKKRFLADVDRDRTLVIYCSGYGCPDSFDLAMLLLEKGYRNVRLFEGGLPEWRDAGLPVEGEGS